MIIVYVRTWKKKEVTYAAIVKSKRVENKVIQEIVTYLGIVSEDQIPYLKAAYAKKKPKLVYKEDISNE